MPLFHYKALNTSGKVVEDILQGNSTEDIAAQLKSSGFQVLIVKKAENEKPVVFGGRVSTSEKAAFCRFIATMLRAGLSLPQALDNIRQDNKNKKLQKILTDVVFLTGKGESLSKALSKYPQDFDLVFLTMVQAGEESGTLDESFDYLANQLLAQHDLSQKIKGSLTYPAVIITAMLANGLVMMVFVLPMISGVFLKMKIKLPALTKLLLETGNFIGNNVLIVLTTVALGIFMTVVLFSLQSSRKITFYLFAKIPIIKGLLDKIDIVRFSRTLSTLLKRGVSIIKALEVASDSLSQDHLKKQAKLFSLGVSKGESLSQLIEKNRGGFPVTMVQTIKAGEKTGSLDAVLKELADFYEKEVEYDLKRMTSLLEPVLMLLIGVVVGAMVIMIIAPIYSIIGGLQSSIENK